MNPVDGPANKTGYALGEIDDPVTITAFFTKDLPAPYSTNRRFLKDKLDDYRAYGGRNVQYKFVDPANDEDLRAEAGRYRIPPVQITTFVPGPLAGVLQYLGIDFHYQNLLRGVIDTRDVLYYLSMTAFAFLLTAYTLARRPE